MLFYNNIHLSKLIIENKLRNQIAHGGNVSHPSGAPATPHLQGGRADQFMRVPAYTIS